LLCWKCVGWFVLQFCVLDALDSFFSPLHQQKLNHNRTGRTNQSPPEWFTSYLETVSVFSFAQSFKSIKIQEVLGGIDTCDS